jgi:ketosteroid isomerase-like protein
VSGRNDRRVEILRRGIQAYNARDTAALLALLDPEVEIVNSSQLPNAGTFHGHEGFRRWMAEWHEAWEDFQNLPKEVIPVGERHVVARVQGDGRGRGSGIEVSMEVGWVYEIRDDLCVFMSLQPSFDAAMSMARERTGLEPASPAGADGGEDPEERVAFMRRGFEAFERADMDALLDAIHPQIEVVTPQEMGNPGTRHGVDGFLEWLREWTEAWDDFRDELLEVVPVGDRHVVGRSHQTARGRGSGVEVSRDVAWVYEIVGGRCIFLAIVPTLDGALAMARRREGLEAP